MWREYSIRYIKENKMTSISIAAITFLAASLLSLLLTLFYNLLEDHIQRNGRNFVSTILIAYGFVLAVACMSLVAMMHNIFEVSMSSRIHQLGILQSVGATPQQIRTFLLWEVSLLCGLPIGMGVLSGILMCIGFFGIVTTMISEIKEFEIIFSYHPAVALLTISISGATVLLSAYLSARKLSRMTPLTAIYYGGETSVDKMKKFGIFEKLFGVYGQLARKSIYARRKSLRTATVSLSLAFLAFVSFLGLETISGLSTKHTYFERFGETWDLMLTVAGAEDAAEELRQIEGVERCIAYQKTGGFTRISGEDFSEEVKALGMEQLDGTKQADEGGNYQIEVQVYLLDEKSFLEYCRENDLTDNSGAVALNLIWDSVHSTRTDREYLPFLKERRMKVQVEGIALAGIEMEITAFSDALPQIREEMKQNALSLVLSESYFKKISGGNLGTVQYYNIQLARDGVELEVKDAITAKLGKDLEYELESRREEEEAEISVRKGLKIFVGAVASLIAGIGIANVFSSVLGQIYQRKKEFLRYLSVGMSTEGMGKILFMEVVIIGLKPMIFSLVINVPVMLWALHTAGIPLKEFLSAAPVLPTAIFSVVVLLFIFLAYYLGGRKICGADIVEVLKDETFM